MTNGAHDAGERAPSLRDVDGEGGLVRAYAKYKGRPHVDVHVDMSGLVVAAHREGWALRLVRWARPGGWDCTCGSPCCGHIDDVQKVTGTPRTRLLDDLASQLTMTPPSETNL